MTRTTWILAGAAVATLSLTGCNKSNRYTSGMSGTTGSASSSRTYASNESAGQQVPADTAFLQAAAMGGHAEVELSQIALRQSARQDVRDFAQRMIADHTAANQQVQQIAQSRGITLPSQPDTEHRQVADQMSSLNGSNLDQQYIRTMLQDHRQTINLFQQEAQNGNDPQIRNLASNILPTLREHLKMVEQLASGQSGSMNGMQMQGQQPATSPNASNPSGASPSATPMGEQPSGTQPSSTPPASQPGTNPK